MHLTGQQRAKGRPLLKLSATKGVFVFQFDTLEDRDSVVETLQSIVTKPDPHESENTQIDLHSEAKQRLLNQDKDLCEMHENLVLRGVLSEAEFWRPRMQELEQSSRDAMTSKEQKAGLASVLMPDITDDHDKAQRVKLNLTPEIIHQIFAEQPHVRAAFVEHVPTDMDEKEFWLKYCKHVYAVKQKRHKIARGDIQGAHLVDDEFADLFTFTKESKEAKELAKQVDPMINLVNNEGQFYDGYGIRHKTIEATTDEQVLIAADVVQDVNQHSLVVLNGLTNADNMQEQKSEKVCPKQRGRTLDDLEEDFQETVVHLEIQNIRKRKAPAIHSAVNKAPRSEDLPPPELLSEDRVAPIEPSASTVLLDLHNGGELRDDDGVGAIRGLSPADSLPLNTLEKLRSKTLIVNELLRHFWASYPVNSSAKEAQVRKLKQALTQQFDSMKKIRDIANSSEEMALTQQLLKPVFAAINAAIDKYTTEMESRQRRMMSTK
eukprot:g2965.t1